MEKFGHGKTVPIGLVVSKVHRLLLPPIAEGGLRTRVDVVRCPSVFAPTEVPMSRPIINRIVRLAMRRRRRMDPRLTLATGLGAGIALTYWLDPQRGHRRRALARDKARHVLIKQAELAGKGGRDVKHRASGVVARLRSLGSDRPADDLLLARVRARLGHHVSNPASIQVEVDDGAVTLRGPVLRHELGELTRAVSRVRGVHCVENELDVHDDPGNIPALQGTGGRARARALNGTWSPARRLLAMGVGATAVGYGLMMRGRIGLGMASMGAVVALRGAAGMPLRTLARGGRRGITIRKSITIDRPVDDVYDFWSDLENLPRFLSHVESISVGADGRSHWELKGPAGAPFVWDAETVEDEPGRELSWRSVGRSVVEHSGRVRFEPAGSSSTRLHVELRYRPPGRALGHAVAKLLGSDPKSIMDEDLQRLKTLLERGEGNGRYGRERSGTSREREQMNAGM